MEGTHSATRQSLGQLILVPALITLAVTFLRLAGELAHWSQKYFNTDVGGGGAIVGITWLAPIFGAYFAMKLVRSGAGPRSAWQAMGFAALGVAVVFGGTFLGQALPSVSGFYGRLLYIWAVFALGGIATFPGWPALFKVQLAYAYAARIPVVIIMFVAFQQGWVTHYSAAPSDTPPGFALWPKFLWLGFFPQLILWVGFTLVSGMLLGSIVAVLARLFQRSAR
ncbi:MAG: hypothetical protein ABSF71_07950 [Terriglobia bacterium]|jgi:hypothetical protein